jgi:hypothetical protein
LTFVLPGAGRHDHRGHPGRDPDPDGRAAWQAGLFSGLVSGIIVYAFGAVMTLFTLWVVDIFGAVAAHLIINLCRGLIGGGLGVLIARGVRPAAATA